MQLFSRNCPFYVRSLEKQTIRLNLLFFLLVYGQYFELEPGSHFASCDVTIVSMSRHKHAPPPSLRPPPILCPSRTRPPSNHFYRQNKGGVEKYIIGLAGLYLALEQYLRLVMAKIRSPNTFISRLHQATTVQAMHTHQTDKIPNFYPT